MTWVEKRWSRLMISPASVAFRSWRIHRALLLRLSSWKTHSR